MFGKLSVMEQYRVTVTKEGRVNLPASVRRELGVEAGDSLGLRVEGGELVLSPEAAMIERLRTLAGPPPKDGELVSEELIRERREEAAKE